MILTMVACGGAVDGSSIILEDRMLESVTLVLDGETHDLGWAEGVYLYTRPAADECAGSTRLRVRTDHLWAFVDLPGPSIESGDLREAPSVPYEDRQPVLALYDWQGIAWRGLSGGTVSYDQPSADVHVVRVSGTQLCELDHAPGPGELGPEHCRPVDDVELTLAGAIGDDGWCATAALVDDSDPTSPMSVPPDDNNDRDYWYCDEGPDSPVVAPPKDQG